MVDASTCTGTRVTPRLPGTCGRITVNALVASAVTPLPLETWLPAPSQGAIGIECRTEDSVTRGHLDALNDAPTRREVEAERALLEALGGSCHSPGAGVVAGAN